MIPSVADPSLITKLLLDWNRYKIMLILICIDE